MALAITFYVTRIINFGSGADDDGDDDGDGGIVLGGISDIARRNGQA